MPSTTAARLTPHPSPSSTTRPPTSNPSSSGSRITTAAASHTTSSNATSSTTTTNTTGSNTSSGLGTTTTIVIAVLASVLGVVFILVIYRYIRRRINYNRSVPLPPVQPIAHHREQQLAQFEERKFINNNNSPSPGNSPSPSRGGKLLWEQQHRHLMTTEQRGSSSDTSLIQDNANNILNSSPNQSLINHKETVPDVDERSLPHPTPAFHGLTTGSVRDSNSSIGSSAPSPFPFPTPETNTSSQPNTSIPNTPRQIRPRPTSMISTTSRKSLAGSTSNSTIRGAPHGPHSTVQIVLPTPLAPKLSPYGHVGEDRGWLFRDVGAGGGLKRVRSDSRSSVVDKWAGVPVSKKEGERERRTSFGEVAATDVTVDYYNTSRHRQQSQPQNASPRNSRYPPPSSFRDNSRTPPPVSPILRIPSVYNQRSAVSLDDDESLNGKAH